MARKINPFHEYEYPPFEGFPADTLSFLRSLKRNNNRTWFNNNKARYVENVKFPMETFLYHLRERLLRTIPGLDIDPRKSMYRIYRDIRFSKDKSPYKTHQAAAFTFSGGHRNHDPGFYLHIEPGNVFIGGGWWMPDPSKLKILRAALAEGYPEFRKILARKKFKSMFGSLEGEKLSRVPRGFEAGHPAQDLLRYKQFLVSTTIPAERILDKSFLRKAADVFGTMEPFVRYLFSHSR